MATLQSFVEATRPNVSPDEYEEGWDCGVDWGNERAVYNSLVVVQQLKIRECHDLGILTQALGCTAVDLFGQAENISRRRLEGFIDGAVAILHECCL